MTELATIGHMRMPAQWKHLETRRFGAFVTRFTYQRADQQADGPLYVWSSRRHRKHYGPELQTSDGKALNPPKHPSFFVWAPGELNWWIAVLFMIGSSGFILGSVLFLAGYSNFRAIGLTFFIGSIFFTLAGYCQYNQSINTATVVGVENPPGRRKWFALQPMRIDFWVTITQFLGTIMFNLNTFDAFLNLGWFGQDLVIWVPDMIGSVLFQVSGTLAVFELCHRWWCWRDRGFSWWITMINFIGCVAFLISALMAFIRPNPIFAHLATWATIFTLIGALCFFIGAYLIWPEMTSEARAEK